MQLLVTVGADRARREERGAGQDRGRTRTRDLPRNDGGADRVETGTSVARGPGGCDPAALPHREVERFVEAAAGLAFELVDVFGDVLVEEGPDLGPELQGVVVERQGAEVHERAPRSDPDPSTRWPVTSCSATLRNSLRRSPMTRAQPFARR